MVCIGNAPVWPVFICCFRLMQIWIIFILTDQQLYFSPINTAALIDWKETAFLFPELHILTAVHQWLIYQCAPSFHGDEAGCVAFISIEGLRSYLRKHLHSDV